MYQRGSLHKHEQLKAHLISHPELVGINKKDVVSIETEYPLKKRKRAIAQPDVVIHYNTKNGKRTKFIEIKSGSCRRALEDLQGQVRKITKFLEHKKIRAEVIGIYPMNNTLVVLK